MKRSIHSDDRHIWLMALPCLAVAGVLVAVTLLGIPTSQAVVYALVLVCPLSHLALMGLHRDGGATSTMKSRPHPR